MNFQSLILLCSDETTSIAQQIPRRSTVRLGDCTPAATTGGAAALDSAGARGAIAKRQVAGQSAFLFVARRSAARSDLAMEFPRLKRPFRVPETRKASAPLGFSKSKILKRDWGMTSRFAYLKMQIEYKSLIDWCGWRESNPRLNLGKVT
jgi:hypothetical protein